MRSTLDRTAVTPEAIAAREARSQDRAQAWLGALVLVLGLLIVAMVVSAVAAPSAPPTSTNTYAPSSIEAVRAMSCEQAVAAQGQYSVELHDARTNFGADGHLARRLEALNEAASQRIADACR